RRALHSAIGGDGHFVAAAFDLAFRRVGAGRALEAKLRRCAGRPGGALRARFTFGSCVAFGALRSLFRLAAACDGCRKNKSDKNTDRPHWTPPFGLARQTRVESRAAASANRNETTAICRRQGVS